MLGLDGLKITIAGVSGRLLSVGSLAVFVLACTPASPAQTPSPAFSTATLPAPVEASTSTATLAAVATATPVSHTGTTTTQVNVRQAPLASASVLGTLDAAASVQVLSRDQAGNWYQIAFEAGDDGRGWVAAQYVSVADPGAVPTEEVSGEARASVREQINVRSGPGTQFDAVGLLSARDVVTLVGRDQSGAWLQISFAAGPEGKGWVAASFLEPGNTESLPIVTEAGEILGTSTPVTEAPAPATAAAIAADDADSAEAPALDARFSPAGLGSVFYSSDLSAPMGDDSDWIRFTPYYDSIEIRLECTGSGRPAVEILEGGLPVTAGGNIECNTRQVVALNAGTSYSLRVSLPQEGPDAKYVNYTLSLFAVLPL